MTTFTVTIDGLSRQGRHAVALSLVRDDGQRTLLFDLDQAIQGLGTKVPEGDAHLLKLTGTYHNLLRQWAIT